MSDPTTPEPAAAPVVPAAATAPQTPVAVTPPVVAEKKKRGAGIWSFILGLVAVLADIGVVIFVLITLFGVLSAFSAGDLAGVSAALSVAGIGFLLVVVFFGGFLVAGLGALLGLIALFAGRGRVIGIFGLLLSAAALGVRISILVSGFDVGSLGG
jgi:hypothetical protein